MKKGPKRSIIGAKLEDGIRVCTSCDITIKQGDKVQQLQDVIMSGYRTCPLIAAFMRFTEAMSLVSMGAHQSVSPG